MRIAVLGAGGMLGARVVEEFVQADHQVVPVTKKEIDLSTIEGVKKAVDWHFDWIVNCAGVVKSRTGEWGNMALVNAALPHWLEDLGARVLHVSTDCVFSGEEGDYSELSQPDPVDYYGATKLAGEITGPRSITVRTSFIGWENGTRRGLLEWLVRQKKVQGYANAWWSGLSAREVARTLVKVINSDPKCGRLCHLAGNEISKLMLLRALRSELRLELEIEEVYEPHIDRTLDGQLFNSEFSYRAPDWRIMAKELAAERP